MGIILLLKPQLLKPPAFIPINRLSRLIPSSIVDIRMQLAVTTAGEGLLCSDTKTSRLVCKICTVSRIIDQSPHRDPALAIWKRRGVFWDSSNCLVAVAFDEEGRGVEFGRRALDDADSLS